MNEESGRRWTQREAMLAYRLYCELPFGRIHRRNPRVVAMARYLRRTPDAVAYKLANFAHLDPALRARGIHGLGNVSALDRRTAEAFRSDWDASLEATEPEWELVDTDAIAEGKSDAPTEGLATVKIRLTQRFFRRAVLSAYDSSCCVCGVSEPELIVASHIMGWAITPKERSNPENGLALCGLHDLAFDAGLLTVRPSLVIAVSQRLIRSANVPVARAAFTDVAGSRIRPPSRFLPAPEFLEYHNVSVFKP